MRNAGANGEESNQPNMQFQINRMGNMRKCNFSIPDATGDNTAMAFRAAYSGADGNDKELCAHVGSMLCAVVPTFRNSVEAALNGSGISPCFVSLPSKAREHNIFDSELKQLDWSSILSVFGYCILVIFKLDIGDFGLLEFANASDSEGFPDSIYCGTDVGEGRRSCLRPGGVCEANDILVEVVRIRSCFSLTTPLFYSRTRNDDLSYGDTGWTCMINTSTSKSVQDSR